MTATWHPRASLRHRTPAALLGVLELPAAPGCAALELHLVDAGGGATVGAWLDEEGRLYRVVLSETV